MAATSLALKPTTGTALTYDNATGAVRVEMDKLLTRIGEAGQDVKALADLFPSQGPQITTLVDSVLNQLMQGQQSLAEVKSQADEALGFLGTSHTEQLRNLLSDPMERLQAEEQAAKPQPTVLRRLKNALVSIFGTSAENTSPQTPAEQLTAELQRRLGKNVLPEIIKTAQELLRKEIGALYEGPGTETTERIIRELVDREKRKIVVACTNSLLEDVRRLIQGVVVHENSLPRMMESFGDLYEQLGDLYQEKLMQQAVLAEALARPASVPAGSNLAIAFSSPLRGREDVLRECLGRTTSEVAVLAQSGVQLHAMNNAAKGAMQGMENIRTSLLPRTQLLTATIFGQLAVGDAAGLQEQAVRTAEGLATLGNTLTHGLITGAARFQSGEADIRSAQSAITTLNGIQAALKEGVTIVGQNHAALEAARAELSEALAKTQEGLQNYDAAVAAVQSGKNTPALAGLARG